MSFDEDWTAYDRIIKRIVQNPWFEANVTEFNRIWCYCPWTDHDVQEDDAGVNIDEGESEGSFDIRTDGGQFSPEKRKEWFCSEIDAFTDHKAELNEPEVTVSIVDPDDTFTIDLEPVVDAGLSYGLVLTDGLVGNHTAELCFQAQETVDPAYHELQDELSEEAFPHIPPAMSERTYNVMIRVRQRWGVSILEVEKFLEDVDFFDGGADDDGSA